jgi:glutamate---cysteine ligase / carboxylate-amine ligase
MTLAAFAGFGIELEYMIVQRDSFDVLPVADRILEDAEACGDAWSNELVAHVLELKNPFPTADMGGLAVRFRRKIERMNTALAALNARLMPGAMHPWMDPRRETRLWTRSDAAIYRAYDRIFDCRAHGWANLQSMQVNLPFAGDDEFARLHAAVRLALPILPALAAASPVRDACAPGPLDCRLAAYRDNSAEVPAMSGQVIPEPVRSRRQYERQILEPLYRALAPHDPEGVLRHEWANARGAIARFDRNAIEIRVLDMQECPGADVALAAAVIDLVWLLYQEGVDDALPTGELARVLDACLNDAEQARIESPEYLHALGAGPQPLQARELWAALAERMAGAPHRALWRPTLDFILARGPLARRMLEAVGADPSREALARLCRQLCECLENDRRFDPSPFS